ncbi:MAG: methyltransferase [Deltaproteobacteria bacterium]|nr:methyltransferase [Deltaproteobacteria bacterium]
MSPQSEFPQDDLAVLRRLPAILRRAGYFDSYGVNGMLHLHFRQVREQLDALPGDLRTLMSLFFLGEQVPAEQLRGIFDPSEIAALRHVGIILEQEGLCHTGGLVLLPLLGQLVFVPLLSPGGKQDGYFGEDSAAQAARTAPPRHARCLDLFAGPGHLSVRCATLAASVVAIETSAVALACAELNLVLNSVDDRVSVREADLYAGVDAGERFDYVVASPLTLPYPASLALTGEAAEDDDGMSELRRTLVGLPAVLAPGGSAQLVASSTGDEDGPHLRRELTRFADEHGLHIVMTVPRRARMRPGDRLFEYLAQTCVQPARPEIQAARELLGRHLEARKAHFLYSVFLTLTHDPRRPGVQMTQHFRYDSVRPDDD